MDKALRRICGLPLHKKPPSTFSRAFEAFTKDKLAERIHEALIKAHFGGRLIGDISRDGTAIKARERPQKNDKEDDELSLKEDHVKTRSVLLNSIWRGREDMFKEIPT